MATMFHSKRGRSDEKKHSRLSPRRQRVRLPALQPAQSYPAKPVKVLVGFAAGGPTDVIARIVAQDMTQSLGQSFVVENRMGANAIIATEAVGAIRARWLHAALLLALAPGECDPLEGRIQYDPFKDFAPVSNAAVLPMVVVTKPGDPHQFDCRT